MLDTGGHVRFAARAAQPSLGPGHMLSFCRCLLCDCQVCHRLRCREIDKVCVDFAALMLWQLQAFFYLYQLICRVVGSLVSTDKIGFSIIQIRGECFVLET